jgi:hypothetical protein
MTINDHNFFIREKEMRKLALMLSLLLLVGTVGGCGKKQLNLNPGVPKNIAVLSLDGNLAGQTADQARELDRTLRWMDRDMIRSLKRAGLNAVLVKDRKSYKKNMGKLLIINVDNFNPGSRAARAFVGYGAGAASLDLNYAFLSEDGKNLLTWKDGVGSSKGATYCAQTLNRNATEKIVNFLNNG